MKKYIDLNRLSPNLRDKIKRQILVARKKEKILLDVIAKKEENERLLWMDSLKKAKAIRRYMNTLDMRLWQIEMKNPHIKKS